MRLYLALLSLCTIYSFGQIKVDTIIDKGIYKSYFNYRMKQPVAVTYTLYQGGGESSRKGLNFINDTKIKTCKGKDYAKSGYDEGHLANAEDFAYSDSLQELTFRYYNCVPQTPELNRGIWKKYENKVRKLSQLDTIIVVCYNEFRGVNPSNLTAPTICYKVVYNSKGGVIFSVGVENNKNATLMTVTNSILHICKKFR